MSPFFQHYLSLCAAGDLTADKTQYSAVETLSEVFKNLHSGPPSFIGRLLKPSYPNAPHGAYIYGDVGRGKTFLMNLFYSCASVTKMRIHFHEFMQKIHLERHLAQHEKDPIVQAMERVCSNISLVCLDEMEIKDIADAMIIGRVLEFLFKSNITLITTSNRHPQELYKDGLHRDRFLQTIHMLCEKLLIINLDSTEDYRLRKRQSMSHYLSPLTLSTQEELLNIFKSLTDSAPVSDLHITIWERDITFNHYAANVLWARFMQLCEANLAAGDYLGLCGHIHTLIIDEVPPFGEWGKDLWRRFILLIDVLYDQHKAIFIRSADPVSKLLDPSHDWSFELVRTHSRLMEMQSW